MRLSSGNRCHQDPYLLRSLPKPTAPSQELWAECSDHSLGGGGVLFTSNHEGGGGGGGGVWEGGRRGGGGGGGGRRRKEKDRLLTQAPPSLDLSHTGLTNSASGFLFLFLFLVF